MQVVKVYVANDGTKFDTEQECLNYEDSISNAEKYKGISALWNESPASSVASFVMNYFDKIKVIMEPEAKEVEVDITEKVIPEVDWEKVSTGTVILVRDHKSEEWTPRQFLRKKYNDYLPFICFSDKGTSTVGWKYAKLITA